MAHHEDDRSRPPLDLQIVSSDDDDGDDVGVGQAPPLDDADAGDAEQREGDDFEETARAAAAFAALAGSWRKVASTHNLHDLSREEAAASAPPASRARSLAIGCVSCRLRGATPHAHPAPSPVPNLHLPPPKIPHNTQTTAPPCSPWPPPSWLPRARRCSQPRAARPTSLSRRRRPRQAQPSRRRRRRRSRRCRPSPTTPIWRR
jgi:hypothetical protein